MIEHWLDLVRFSDEMCLRLVITLLHFVWQGALLALIVLVAGRALRGRSAASRYTVNAVALLCMPICVAATFLLVDVSVSARPMPTSAGGSVEGYVNSSSTIEVDGVSFAAEPTAAQDPLDTRLAKGSSVSQIRPIVTGLHTSNQALSKTVRTIAGTYFLCVCFLLLRFGAGVWGGQRLRASARQIGDPRIRSVIAERARQVGLKFVPIVGYCERIAVPTVIGLARPMVLLPCSLIGLNGDHLAAVITHELAHIRRHDLLMNVIQRLVESLLFFHPGTWYVSRRMSAEREVCCDDLVLASGKDRLRYVQALLEMADLCLGAKPAGVTALAVAGTNPSEFEARIQRLMDVRPNSRMQPTRLGLLTVLVCLAMTVALPGLLQTWATAEVTSNDADSADVAAQAPERSKTSQPAKDRSKSSTEDENLLGIVNPGLPVSVLCVDAEGKPVEGAEVHLFQNRGLGNNPRYLCLGPVNADAQGKASFSRAIFYDATGNFDRWVYARVPGRLVGVARSLRSKSRRSIFNPEARVQMMPSRSVEGAVTVPDGVDPRSVTVSVRTMHVVTGDGDFDFQSFPRSSRFLDKALPEIFECRPDTDGRIRFNDMPVTGRLYLVTSGKGLGEAQWRNDLVSRTFDKPIEIAIEEEMRLYGRLQSPEGEPVAGAEVSARISSPAAYLSTFRTVTNEAGEFEISGLPDLEFVVSASDPASHWVFRPLEGVHGLPRKGRELILKMEAGVQVSGKVVDTDGTVVEGAAVSAIADTQEGPGLDDDVTDHTGQYRLYIPAGSAKLYFNSLPDGFQYPNPQIIKRLEIEPGQAPIADLDFTLERQTESDE